jgi:hypothetical protein
LPGKAGAGAEPPAEFRFREAGFMRRLRKEALAARERKACNSRALGGLPRRRLQFSALPIESA